MNRNTVVLLTGILLIAAIAGCGCTKYADPVLDISHTITRVSEDPRSGNLTYDLAISIANTGTNNAYQVKILAIISTPHDLPEYRFINSNIDIGDVPKGETRTHTERLVLPATRENYDLIISGTRQPEVDIKPTEITSNIMG